MAYNRVLYEFQAVIDIDIGIAQLMNEEYNNPAFVNTKMLLKQYILLNFIFIMHTNVYIMPRNTHR